MNEEENNEVLKKHIENLNRELSQNKERLDFHEKLLLQLRAEKARVMENHDIILSKFKIICPTWEYETDEKYIENIKYQQGLRKEFDERNFDKNDEQIQNVIKVSKEQIESIEKELERLKVE